MSFAAKDASYAMLAFLLNLPTEEVRSWPGGREFVLVKQIDIAFRTTGDVAFVEDSFNSGKVVASHHRTTRTEMIGSIGYSMLESRESQGRQPCYMEEEA